MSINALLRGVSVGAVVVVVASSTAEAQQNLPTINVGAGQRMTGRPQGGPTSSGAAQRGVSQPGQSQSAAAKPILGIPQRQDSYVVKTTSTATKMSIPILQLPASVKVVPAEVMQDQQVTDLKGALENVSGVQSAQTQGGNASFNRIRGFLTPRVFRNGLMATSPTNFTDFGMSNVERVEVTKGPDAMLYGRSDPGGMINLITKRPIVDRIHMIQQRFGQFDNYFTEWDLADSANADRSVFYRFSGGYMNSGGFRNFDRMERVHVNPSVAWHPTQDTTFVADVEYYDQDFRPNLGLTVDPFNPTRPTSGPISRNFAGPHTPLSNNRNIYAGSELTHRFNDTFTFKQRFLAAFLHHNDAYSSNAFLATTNDNFGAPVNGDISRNPFSQQNDSQVYGTNFDLLGHFDLGETHHDTLVGFDYQHVYSLYGNQGRFFPFDPRFTVNMYYPWSSNVYAWIPTGFYNWQSQFDRPRFLNDRQVNISNQEGLYFQDHITFLDGKLHLLGGGRFDWFWQGQARGSSGSLAESYIYSRPYSINPLFSGNPFAPANLQYNFFAPTRSDAAFSPRVGLLFQPVPWASFYGSWTQAFGPNVNGPVGVDAYNRPFAPGRSEQVEIGAKADWFDGRLTTTLALYHLTKTNIPARDPAAPNDPNAFVLVGAARSEGVELDASGKITNNLSLISSFTYMDARVTKDTNSDPTLSTLGRRLIGIPRYQGSFWAKWDVKEIEALDGLSLGFGVFVVGNRQGDDLSTFQLPGYVRLDAMAAYTWKIMGNDVTAQLNLRNLGNARYFESADNNFSTPKYSIYPGAPFTAMGTVRVAF